MTFFITLVFMFLVFWRPQDWLFPWMFGLPVLDIVVFVAMLTLLMESNEKRVNLPKGSLQAWLLPGLWFATLMSHVAHTYFAGIVATLPETFKFCFFTYLLIVVLDSPRRLRTVAWLFVIMAMVMTVHALLQQERGYGFGGQMPVRQWRPTSGRWILRSLFFGIFEDPNDLAQFLATAMPFAFVLFRRMSVVPFLVGVGVVAFLLVGVQATGSRSGYVALVVTGGLMLCALLTSRRQPVALLLLILAGAVAFPYAGAFLDASAHDRIAFWGDANQAFKASPIFGVGYGVVLEEYISESRAVHNAFVACYASIGIFGYWFWFGLLYSGVEGLWRTLLWPAEPRSIDGKWMIRYCNMTLASFGGFMASAYFLSRDFVYPLFFLLGILAAIPLVARRLQSQEDEDAVPVPAFSRPRFVALNTVFSLGSIAYIYVSILILNRVW